MNAALVFQVPSVRMVRRICAARKLATKEMHAMARAPIKLYVKKN